MSAGTPVDALVAEIGRAADLETVLRLQRYLTGEVVEHWRAITRASGDRLEVEPIVADIERISEAAEQRRAELSAADPGGLQ